MAERVAAPPPLRAGGTVGIIAPAGRVDPLLLRRGAARLTRLGLTVRLGRHVTASHRYFAGTDAQRAADFQEMLENPEVDAVVCARGGVGAARIIPHLAPERLAGRPKIFVGASDITTLLLYLHESFGWITFHGPMAATQFGRGSSSVRESQFLAVLGGKPVEMRFDGVTALAPGTADGPLTGGCLTLLCTTIGTPYEIETAGKILFIEDVNEAPYRIDRMLAYLKAVGKFKRVRGVVFGQMPGCRPDVLPEVILDLLGPCRIPILFGFPCGHGDATATLPIGARVSLDADSCALKILEPRD